MRSNVGKWLLALLFVLGVSGASAGAEDGKALPTLLIKGEIVSVDSTDPGAMLVKVKDRYGFETPIFLQQDTKVSQGDASVSPSNLSTGTPVEVEYNFDVNTAKRHAVSVKVAPAAQAAEAPVAPVAAPAAPAAPADPAAPESSDLVTGGDMTAPPSDIETDAAPEEAVPSAE